jgi:hypothetical protein
MALKDLLLTDIPYNIQNISKLRAYKNYDPYESGE